MLAIIIPYYKITFFDETLKSLSVQTDKRFKVYIGDDGSPENPEMLLKKYIGEFDFIYHRFDENVGGSNLVKQWERCINLCEEQEWLMMLCDDDVLSTNTVQKYYENLIQINNNGVKVIRFSTFKIDEQGEIISNQYTHPMIENSKKFIFRKTRSSLSEYIFYKEAVNLIGFKNLPLAWHADRLAILEFSNFGNVFTINDSKVLIRSSQLSISGNNSNIREKSIASFMYFYYLATIKRSEFNHAELRLIHQSLNKTYQNDKRNLARFFKISFLYVSTLNFKELVLFIRKILINYLKSLNMLSTSSKFFTIL